MREIEWNSEDSGVAAAELEKAADIFGSSFPAIDVIGFGEFASSAERIMEQAKAYHDGIVKHLEYGAENLRETTRDFEACDLQVQESLQGLLK